VFAEVENHEVTWVVDLQEFRYVVDVVSEHLSKPFTRQAHSDDSLGYVAQVQVELPILQSVLRARDNRTNLFV